MSLYYEAAAILTNTDKAGGSLKSRIYNRKDLKSAPAQIYGLVVEASKWSAVLKEVIERSELLKLEKKLTPILALLVTHDLLLAKKGIAAHSKHEFQSRVGGHKARLSAELTKTRIRKGFSTLEAFREYINAGNTGLEDGSTNEAATKTIQHPRWVRVNTLRTTLEEQLSTTFAEYEKVEKIADILSAPGKAKVLHIDSHIPNLLALPPKADLTKSKAYASGLLIFQDKASCFPAYLLDVGQEDGDVIDACAAPGNKTTHLTAIMSERSTSEKEKRRRKVIAFEKDKKRAAVLEKMVEIASPNRTVIIRGGQDFTKTNPNSEEFSRVGALLLDPSCSGSGIVGRDDSLKIYLPDPMSPSLTDSNVSRSKKRKRPRTLNGEVKEPPSTILEVEEDAEDEAAADDLPDERRLQALSMFQFELLVHAMHFPAARKITYSTCSVHFEENEEVVFRALVTAVAKDRGWKILKRSEQVEGMRNWSIRGIFECGKMFDEGMIDVKSKPDVLDACIRCEKGTKEGTMGFFVAAFVRDDGPRDTGGLSGTTRDAVLGGEDEDQEEEWMGFSDEQTPDQNIAKTSRDGMGSAEASSKRKKKKRKA